MKKRKGFTLIEVVISLVVIAIISVAFTVMISGSLTNQLKTKAVTSNLYADQENLEKQIYNERVAVNKTGYETIDNAFYNGVSVKIKPIQIVGKTQTMYSAVADFEKPFYNLPEITGADVKIYNEGALVPFGYADLKHKALGNYTTDGVGEENLLVMNYSWYFSRTGFNIPYTSDYKDIDLGSRLPIFPDDFERIPNELDKDLDPLKDYSGRHIVFVATPVAKNGEFGVSVSSIPKFIHGLPIRTDLILDLEASFIDSSNIIDGKIKKWNDISIHNAHSKSEGAEYPEHYGRDKPVVFVADRVKYSEDSITVSNHTNIYSEVLTIFAIVKGDEVNTNYIDVGTQYGSVKEISLSDGYKLVSFKRKGNGSYLQKITVGGADIEIAELLVYSKDMYDSQRQIVEEYLVNKYQPVDNSGILVDHLEDMEDTAIQNEPYTMPTVAPAYLVNGYKRLVPVKWSGTIDTSNAGEQKVEGHMTSDPSKKLTLEVNVVPYIKLVSINFEEPVLNLKKNETVENDLFINPTDATEQDVIYESSDSSIAKVYSNGEISAVSYGRAVITATVNTRLGPVSDTCVVNIMPKLDNFESMVLWLDANLPDSFVKNSQGAAVWKDQTDNSYDFYSIDSYDNPEYVAGNGTEHAHIRIKKGQALRLDSPSLGKATLSRRSRHDFTVFLVYKHDEFDWSPNSTVFSQIYHNRYLTDMVCGINTYRYFREDRLRALADGYVLQKKALIPFNNDRIKYNKNVTMLEFDKSESILSLFWSSGELHANAKSDRLNSRRFWKRGRNEPTHFYIGSGPNDYEDYFMDGKIYEIIVYDRLLTQDQKDSTYLYLKHKWGISND